LSFLQVRQSPLQACSHAQPRNRVPIAAGQTFAMEPRINVHRQFEYQVHNQPYATALVEGPRAWTYLSVHGWADELTAHLIRKGVRAADVVGIVLGNTAVHLVAVLALAKIGAVCISLAPSKLRRMASPDWTALRLKHVLVPEAATANVGSAAIAIGAQLLVWNDQENQRPQVPEAAIAAPSTPGEFPGDHGDTVFKIALSSGATGRQKAVPWTHHQFLAQLHLQRAVRPFGPGIRLLPLVGFEATVGIDACLRQLCAGGTVVTVPRASIDRVCAAIDVSAVTHVLSTPGIIARYVRELEPKQQRFPQLQGLRITGGAVSEVLRRRISRTFCENITVDFGASEIGTVAVGTPQTYRQSDRCAGRIAPWIEAQAVDDADRVLACGESGRLRFRHDHMPQQYRDGRPILRDGWFYSGDHGRVDATGLLFVESRSDDILNIGGVKVLPADIESAALNLEGVIDACAYAVPTEAGTAVLIVAVEARPGFDETSALASMRASLGSRAPAKVLRVNELPRNEMGKILRRQLIEATKVTR
jgi:acyl-CoA synthetase (AMP-forming)/AMP-acid ligase II